MAFFDKLKKTDLMREFSETAEKVEEEVRDIYESIPSVKKRKQRKTVIKILKISGLVLAGLAAGLFIVSLVSAVSLAGTVSSSIKGTKNLESAFFFAKKDDSEKAIEYSKKSQENFNAALSSLRSKKKIFGIFPLISGQLDDIEYLISAAEVLSRSAYQGLSFAENLKNYVDVEKHHNFSQFSQEEKKNILKYVYESGPELSGLKANLDLALFNLERISFRGVLWPIKRTVEELEEKIVYAADIMEKAVPASRLFPALAGYPDKSAYLFLLQNSDELRPTGGFIGTYGVVEAELGDIVRFDTHDVYHLDMPIKDKLTVEPPLPIKKYLVPNWYFRDSNWSPDFPTTAEKALWFYQEENKLLPENEEVKDTTTDFDGCISITPEFIIDLLGIVGPIEIEGEVYDQNNFTDLLEYRVEKGYIQLGVPKWHRKEVVGDIAKEIKVRLFDLPVSKWPRVMEAINESILKKNILLSFRDQDLELLAREEGLAGELKDTSGDYVMIVDSNMAAAKTDAVMAKSASYSLSQGTGGLFAKLKINYAHNGGFDWKTTRYQNYTRIYVPKGSQLTNASGFKDGVVGEELGKTYFAGFISVEPGEIGFVELEYKLPENIAKNIFQSGYNLYFQKQPGNDIGQLTVNLDWDNNIMDYSPAGFSAERIGRKQIRWVADLDMDRSFEATFRQ